jgi:urocanate hydratase
MEVKKMIRAEKGTDLSCKGWVQEAALRMLHNNLDPDVAEKPDELRVYGGLGKAARNWESFDLIEKALKDITEEETLLVQSGKPVGVLRTHKDAPRVIISNSVLVPKWATWEHFRELDDKGLMMYGQMTAGSWIYIGSQGIVQGTYETYLSIADKHFNGCLKGTLNVTAGLGGMGGAQPLAITMNEGTCLAADIEEWRIQKRIETRYIDEIEHDIDAAIDKAIKYKEEGKALSIGVVCNAVDLLQRMIDRGITPDTLTDQTSAHDELIGYFPAGMSVEEANILRERDPDQYSELSLDTMAIHVRQM